MEELFLFVLGKMLVLFMGMITRYCFFWLIGRKKSLKQLTYGVEAGKDIEKEFAQDVYNSIVGVLSLIVIGGLIARIAFS